MLSLLFFLLVNCVEHYITIAKNCLEMRYICFVVKYFGLWEQVLRTAERIAVCFFN